MGKPETLHLGTGKSRQIIADEHFFQEHHVFWNKGSHFPLPLRSLLLRTTPEFLGGRRPMECTAITPGLVGVGDFLEGCIIQILTKSAEVRKSVAADPDCLL